MQATAFLQYRTAVPPAIALRLAACLTLLLNISVGSADEDRVDLQQQKLQAVREQIVGLQKELEEKIGERSQLEQQLGEVEKQLNEQHRNLRRLQKDLRDGERQLNGLHDKENLLYAELRQQRAILTAQIRTSYFIGNQEHLKILLNQQDPSALARALKYFEYLNRARLRIIESSRATLQTITVTQTGIEQQNKRLADLVVSQQREYQAIVNSRNARRVILDKIKTEIQTGKNSVVNLRQDENRIRELIATLTGIFADIPPETSDLPFSSLKGALPWPVKGQHLNQFGASRPGTDLNWRGIKIAATGGETVRAISHGRVAFADWIPMFGLIVLIDHGDGYMSLYAHNQSLYKVTGDWVQADEIIANVGSSGGEEIDSLYFEIRYSGKPLDPEQWCINKQA